MMASSVESLVIAAPVSDAMGRTTFHNPFRIVESNDAQCVVFCCHHDRPVRVRLGAERRNLDPPVLSANDQ